MKNLYIYLLFNFQIHDKPKGIIMPVLGDGVSWLLNPDRAFLLVIPNNLN